MASGLLTPTHIALGLIVLLLILGPRRLPQTGRALGTGIREFRQAITERDSESPTRSDSDTAQSSGETSPLV
jgi:sec-independent protein translocase protein TatA